MEEEKALRAALHLLKIRDRSVFELKSRLKRKKFPPAIIDKIIAKLLTQKLLDDEKFAKLWIDFRSSFRPKGERVLRLELQKFGLAQEIIDQALKGQSSQDVQFELAYKAALKKRAFKTLPPDEFHQKITGFLARRGFSWEVIQQVIAKMSKSEQLG